MLVLPFPDLRAPKPHNLPFASLGKFFQGREEMLTLLRQKLTEKNAGKATAIAGKAVHGLGGVGKSRLAIEYAWRYAAEYSALLFVGAGSPADLRRNLAALCGVGVLNLPEQAAKEEEIQVAAALNWLAGQPGWLLILDNLDSEEAAAAVGSIAGRLRGGHLLLTGRLARWGAEVEPIELDVLTEEAAVTFLLARTEARRRATKEDAAQATALARELGFLPLALEQAAAYIAERKLTLAGYLKEWHSQHEKVVTWFDSRVSHYPASVAVTWQTSFDRLTGPARRLLERLAWLGPEPIPEPLLEVAVPDLPEADATPDPHDALVDLATYSLVTRAADAPTFTVHRLVQDVTRRSLANDPGQGPLNEALRWVNAAFVGNPQDVRTWPTLDPLAPHARAVVSFADAAGITDPTATLMNNLALLLKATNRLAEAEPLMRRALAIFLEFTRRTGHEQPYQQVVSATTGACFERWASPTPRSRRRSRGWWRTRNKPCYRWRRCGGRGSIEGAEEVSPIRSGSVRLPTGVSGRSRSRQASCRRDPYRSWACDALPSIEAEVGLEIPELIA